MSDVAIRVEHLSKQYRLGGQQATYATFRETLVEAAKTPLRWLKGERQTGQDTFWALDDVSFEVKHGEAVGIIGRNGAGKSTLLKILSRITSPTRGRVDLYGRVGSLLEVGTGFHPELTGRENIYLNGAILGMSRAEIARKFDEIVTFAEIEKFLDTPVKHYSSGMYVRLAFAVAAHLEPEILIVDEVLAVGDAQFQKKCLGKMGDVTRQGRTVLFVSHNMGAVLQLCSRVITLDNGCLSKDGEPRTIVDSYINYSQKKNRVIYEPEPERDVQIQSISVTDSEGNLIDSLFHTYPLQIHIDYKVNKWPVGSYVCMDVFNEHDQRLMWTCDVRSIDEMVVSRKPGIYRSKINIPELLLAPGKYYFTCAIYDPSRTFAFEAKNKAVSIDILDGGSFLSRLGINFHALTTIPLTWDVSDIDELFQTNKP